MHECPDCGLVCDCDGQNTWFAKVLECDHVGTRPCLEEQGEELYEDDRDDSPHHPNEDDDEDDA
jgi:hypothetical protein